MSVWPACLVLGVVGAAVLCLVYYYANRKTPWYVMLVTFLGWYFPISIIVLLPLDMSSVSILCVTVIVADSLA